MINSSADWTKALDEFAATVPGYYLNAFRDFARSGGFEGLRILEIGGSSLPFRLVHNTLRTSQWVCVDIINHASGAYQQQQHADHYSEIGIETLAADTRLADRPYQIFDGSAEKLPASFHGQFDAVFAINAFEHVTALPAVLAELRSALRPGGRLFSQFGPIWSCHVGSHFWVKPEFCFNAPGPMPPWGHLLHTREELDHLLIDRGVTDGDRHRLLYQTYESGFVNRLFFEDYEEAMRHSGFVAPCLDGLWETSVPTGVQQALEARYPGRKNFGSYGIRIVARRSATESPAVNTG